MTKSSAFTEELCNWLKTLPFASAPIYQPDFALPLLEVATTDGVILKIIPVALSGWETSESELLLKKLTKHLQSIRNEGCMAVALWEDYWLGRKSIVQSRLAAMLGISAKIPGRLTQVRRISNVITEEFLEANHLNGNVTSKFRYGLFLPARYFRVLPEGFAFDASAEEILVAVATFSNARIFNQDNAPFRSHELIRFASLAGTNVVGALDKLLHAFIREKSPDDIMTYADLEWSDGRSYRTLGFEQRGFLPPLEVTVSVEDMRRVRVKAPQSATQTPVEYLTLYNLGSIKYVRTVKSVEFHA